MTNTFRLLGVLFFLWIAPFHGVFADAPPPKEETLPILPPFPGEEEAPHPVEKDLMSEFWQMMFYLGVILALFVAVTWFLKKANVSRTQQMNEMSQIKILESRHLSPKSMIHLVEIDNIRLVVGETHAGITRLGHFSKARENFSEILEKENHENP